MTGKKRTDCKRINVNEEHECRYWAERFGVTPEELKTRRLQVWRYGRSCGARTLEPQSVIFEGRI